LKRARQGLTSLLRISTRDGESGLRSSMLSEFGWMCICFDFFNFSIVFFVFFPICSIFCNFYQTGVIWSFCGFMFLVFWVSNRGYETRRQWVYH